MATLTATGCNVGTQSVTVFFSDKINQNTPPPAVGGDPASGLHPANYTLFAPDAGFVNTPFLGTVKPISDQSVELEFANPVFTAGQWVQVTVTRVASTNPGISAIVSSHVSGRTPTDSARGVRDIEDAISYPVLTEEVAYRPSSVGISTTGAGGITGPGGSNLGQVALQAVSDVLGWKANSADPKGFVGALSQSFTLSDVEGHVEAMWKPRSYAVQTDLGGGITGAQASLYMRAKDALDQSLNLLDGLYPLNPEADPEYVKALREMARSQMTEIVKELGVVGLPSILRINTYFSILLGLDVPNLSPGGVEPNPDKIGGTLGKLRDTYGIHFRGNAFNNSVEDEQDITNFRVISDYMTSLCQSWIANRDFFRLKADKSKPAFFGTQLVLISRQFNVIAETVNELRFALDSVFIGPNERQTLLLEFDDHSLAPMFLEDVLDEIDGFVTEEGPRLLRDGGKISVTNNILPVVESLKKMIQGAHHPTDQKKRIPDGFRTARVRHALDDVEKQLTDLVDLTKQVEQEVPPSEDKLAISGVIGPLQISERTSFKVGVLGTAFDRGIKAQAHSPVATSALRVDFVSRERVDITFPYTLASGSHALTLENSDGDTATLPNAFQWNPQKLTVVIGRVSLPAGIAGTDYNPNSQIQLTASGGVAPYSWVVIAGSLPYGLTLSSQGAITGTPNPGSVGDCPFTVMATDSNGSTATQQFSISVTAVLSITTTSLQDATEGSGYSQTLAATGGVQPYQWSVPPRVLPSGLNLDADTGEICGAPTAFGDFTLNVTVTDWNGTQTTKSLTIHVNEHCIFAGVSRSQVFHATVGSYYSQTLQVVGGTPPYMYSLPAYENLPDGLSLTPDGTISGTPTSHGLHTFTVQVTDSNGSAATQSLVISVREDWRDRAEYLDRRMDEISQKLDQLIDQAGNPGRHRKTVVNVSSPPPVGTGTNDSDATPEMAEVGTEKPKRRK